ncbi:SsgA family sporulation/cell division regulator [Streptomyces phyllanthi]|uniref:SsgA family sporulation/cell division regulator n=1 Tax=Streptomyces phyllanthi TaxID=1803180 RepID=A0A5N8W9P2_9ACTN|nr:SsgA family sporulation/cell division regulator [Streptomyces phyllanthi]MPY43148.1 SsgA family sporulation/cell division regulator [Streptomyces phyllanthi]
MSVVEQYARAHVVTDSPEAEDAVPVLLRYDSEADPLSVHVNLPGLHEGPHDWEFSRDLMERGLSVPATSGGVSIWPCGRVQAVIEFHSAEGVEVMQFDSHALLRFLRRTYTAGAPVGR